MDGIKQEPGVVYRADDGMDRRERPVPGQWRPRHVTVFGSHRTASAYEILAGQIVPFATGSSTRHYRGSGKLQSGFAPLAAWLHFLDALPWRADVLTVAAEITAAYAPYTARDWSSLSIGARAAYLGPYGAIVVAHDLSLQPVRFRTASEVAEWLSRGAGPVVVGGKFRQGMFTPNRETGIAERTSSHVERGHAVALVGFKPKDQLVRWVNNEGVGWGDLGRSWMYLAELDAIIRETGSEAWGLVPSEPVLKRQKEKP